MLQTQISGEFHQVAGYAPSALADSLDTVVQGLLERDREVAHVLATARDALRAIDWARYAAHVSQRSARRTFACRHKGHGVRRGAVLAATTAMLLAAMPEDTARVDALVAWLYGEGTGHA